jgi:hypothetical protein
VIRLWDKAVMRKAGASGAPSRIGGVGAPAGESGSSLRKVFEVGPSFAAEVKFKGASIIPGGLISKPER